MESEIVSKAQNLKEELKKSPKVLRVKELEKKMLDDKQVALLIMAYQNAQEEVNTALRFKEDPKEAYNKLSKVKEELYTHELVKEYLAALKEANAYLKEVSDYVFDGIKVLKKEVL